MTMCLYFSVSISTQPELCAQHHKTGRNSNETALFCWLKCQVFKISFAYTWLELGRREIQSLILLRITTCLKLPFACLSSISLYFVCMCVRVCCVYVCFLCEFKPVEVADTYKTNFQSHRSIQNAQSHGIRYKIRILQQPGHYQT